MWCLIAKEKGVQKLRHHIHFTDEEYRAMCREEDRLRELGLHVLTQQKCFKPIEKPIPWSK